MTVAVMMEGNLTVLISEKQSDQIKPQDEQPQGAACFPDQEAAIAEGETSMMEHRLIVAGSDSIKMAHQCLFKLSPHGDTDFLKCFC